MVIGGAVVSISIIFDKIEAGFRYILTKIVEGIAWLMNLGPAGGEDK